MAKKGFFCLPPPDNEGFNSSSTVLCMPTNGMPPYEKKAYILMYTLTLKRGFVFFPYDKNIYGLNPQHYDEYHFICPSLVSINGCIYRGSICGKNVAYIKGNTIFVR